MSNVGGVNSGRVESDFLAAAPEPNEVAAAAAQPATVVGYGARGDAAKAIQADLVKLGYLPRGGDDGIYGRGTQSAVAAFQTANGLPATGDVDQATKDALAAAVELGAKKLPSGAKPNDVVFVGMGKDTKHEIDDLKRRTGVVGITDSATPDQAKLTVGGRTQTFDLTTDAGIDGYVKGIGLSGARATEAAALIKEAGPDARDETAQVVKAFVEAERGERSLERLVLSGHSIGEGVWGDGNGTFGLDLLKKIADTYPRAAGQVEDLLIAGCYSSSEEHVDRFRSIFPNLKSSMAYGDSAPGTWSGAMVHNRAWEQATRGHDPSKVDRDIVAGTRKGDNVATWNSADGYQADGPQRPLSELRAELARTDPSFAPFFRGDRNVQADHEGPLREHYRAIQATLGSRDLPAAERAQLEAKRDQTIRLIFYDSNIRGKFQSEHAAKIRDGYQAVGMTPPDFSRLSRKDALASIAAFEAALAAKNPKPAAANTLRPLLAEGLRDLKRAHIPDNWV